MDINVLKLVKKRGPKKLRGGAAVAAKKRAVAAAAKQQQPRISDIKPYESFSVLPMVYMSDQIDEYIYRLVSLPEKTAKQLKDGILSQERNVKLDGRISKADLFYMYYLNALRVPNISSLKKRDIQMPKLLGVFHKIKSRLPWSLVPTFFKEFIANEPDLNMSVINFFNKFYNREDVKLKVMQMEQLMKDRQATGLRNAERNVWTGNLDDWVSKARAKQPPLIPAPRVASHTFGPGDIPSNCENEYRRAPWTNNPEIVGFVVRNTPLLNKYATTMFKDWWYNVGKSWYKDACDKQRNFIEGAVGYMTRSGDVITETREMFESSLREWKKPVAAVEFQNVSPDSFAVAQDMLENSILPKDAVQGVLTSIKPTTNHDMARGLSNILVYLDPLIKGGDQVHHFRVKNSYYKPEDLIHLDKYTLLPEIFRNPESDHIESEITIEKKRHRIENAFYEALSRPFDPFVRKTAIVKQTISKYLQTDARKKCPSGVDDVIYYNEDGRIYCFDRIAILGKKVNPFTGKTFRQDFFNELAKITHQNDDDTDDDIFYDSNDDLNDDPPPQPQRRSGVELAPGLFQKLKTMILTLHCNNCDKEIYAPKYKSVHGTERLYFCSRECFDAFEF